VEHEEWGDMPQGVLRGSLTGKACITCQCFGYETDAHCRALLVCNLHRAHIPQGQHLTKSAGTGRSAWRSESAGLQSGLDLG
jgi:hypothetical protein